MLIGALLVIACGLLVAGFITGITAYAIGALVLSAIAAVLYGIALRRVAAEERASAEVGHDADADGESDDAKPVAAARAPSAKAEPAKADAKKADAKKADAKKADAKKADAKKADAKKADAKKADAKKADAKKADAKLEAEPAKKTDAPKSDATKPVVATKSDVTPAAATNGTESAEKAAPARPTVAAAVPERKPEPAAAPEPTVAASAAGPQGGDIVHVVPGRMRYHVEGCKLLDGQDAEALTLEDAKDEGFSACSRCAGRKVLTTQG